MGIRVRQIVNEIFAPLWEKNARYYILMGGRGAGRSTAASQYVLSKLLAPQFFRCAIMRGVSTDIRHTIWKELNDRIDEQGVRLVMKIADSEMSIQYGKNSVQAHGFKASSGSLTARLKSLANYNCVVIEEAEEVGEKEFMQLDDSLRTVKGSIRIILMLNPPAKNHWIVQRWFDCLQSNFPKFYIPSLKKDAHNVIYVGGTFRDNIQNLDKDTVDRYEMYEKVKPEYYYQMIAGLVPEVVRGKVYNGWELIDDVPAEARLVRFGEDFGWFPDPAAVVAVYYWNGGYVLDELAYGLELSNEFLAGKIKECGDVLTIADSAEPKSIDEQKTKYHLRIEGSQKGSDSVNFGIKVVAQKRIYVTKKSVNLWNEYENYAWEEDKDGNLKGITTHRYSHGMDATRYALVSLLSMDDDKKVSVNTPLWKSYGRMA